MPNRDHCCVPQCQNNRAISERRIPSKAVCGQNTARRGKKFQGKSVRLSM